MPTTHQIEAHIERTREALGSNLNELERKVKAVADWKQQFQKWPVASLGLAFGGGVALAAIVGGRSKRNGKLRPTKPPIGADPLYRTGRQNGAAIEAWANVKGALISVAATRLLGFVEDVLPGFRRGRARSPEETLASQPNAR